MDVSVTDGPFLSRIISPRGFTAISHAFYMDLNALYVDLGLGFLIAGALAAWVPNSWWQAFFLTDHPTLNEFWSPLIGPVISMLSFEMTGPISGLQNSRSEEHTSELQSHLNLVCRLLLEKKTPRYTPPHANC